MELVVPDTRNFIFIVQRSTLITQKRNLQGDISSKH